MNFTTIENFLRQIPLLAPLADIEHRIQHRFPTESTYVLLSGKEKKKEIKGKVLDISETGMAFQYPAPIHEKEVILSIIFNGKSVAENIPCTIAWEKKTKSNDIKYGARFGELTPLQIQQIDEFIQNHTVKFMEKFFYPRFSRF